MAEKIKIMSLAGGLPHYYNLVLNKLQRSYGVNVSVVVPSNKNGATLGAGVHTSNEGIEFDVYYLDEYTTYYGKSFFKGLKKLILQVKPDILMVNWPYQLSFVFYPFWYHFLRKNKIAIISKEIPFQVPSYENAINYYLKGGGITENKQHIQKNTSIISYLKFLLVRETRKCFANKVDAHINYLDEAVEMHQSYGVAKEKIFISNNSPDTDIFLDLQKSIDSIASNPYKLLHIGRLVKWKNVDLLINATVKIKRKFPQVSLDIVGVGPELDHLKRLVKTLNADDFIHFKGGIYDPLELAKITSEAGIYVLAGMGGLSINEAMCFKKPIICSIADGTEKKLVKENFNGYYFENNSLESLKAAIEKLFNQPENIKKFGENSQLIIRNEINIHTVLSKYMEAFNFVIQKKNQ